MASLCNLKMELMFYMILCNILVLNHCLNISEQCWNNMKIWDTTIHPEYRDLLVTNGTNTTIRMLLATASVPNGLSSIGYEYLASALTMAYKAFCDQGGLRVRDQKFEIVFLNDQCDPNIGVPNVIEMIGAGVDVVFGMPCSTVTLYSGFYLKHWNIPVLTYASNDGALSDKQTYSTLIRVGAGYKQIGLAFIEILKAFNWNRVSILTRDFGLCDYGGSYVNDEVQKQQDMTVVEYNRVSAGASNEQLLRYLRNFNERARVLVVCLPSADMIRFMDIAESEGMTSPEYVYLSFSLMPSKNTLQPWGSTEGLDQATIDKKKKPFTRLKILTPADMTGPSKVAMMQEIADKMSEYPWYINSTKLLGVSASPYSLYLYDCMWLYLTILNETINEGLDPRNGTLIFERARNRIFNGASGEVIMDDVADRIPNYWLWQIQPGEDQFSNFATLRMISAEGQRVMLQKPAYWGTTDGKPPPNQPKCGYRNELCPPSTKGRDAALIGGFCCLALVIVIVFTAIMYYRKRKFEQDLQKMTWKIFYDDIEFSNKAAGGSSIGMSLKSLKSAISNPDDVSNANVPSVYSQGLEQDQIFTKVGFHKGVVCAIRKIEKTDCKLSRMDLIAFKTIKDIQHENINTFVGACIVEPYLFILSNYCSKGSLQDILEHDEIKLDWTFKCSLIFDLVNGLGFIHNSPLMSHGHLKSSCCLIDSRWVLKIGNVGLNTIKRVNVVTKQAGEYEMYRDELWVAPEILRLDRQERPMAGTQKGDIYSFSIILQEILFRTLPYFMEDMSPQDITQKIKKHSDPPFRPPIPSLDNETDPNMVKLMEVCWDESVDNRPDISYVKKRLTFMNKGRKVNILDNMVQKLERYANNLEEIVEKRTGELVQEKQKTDLLLYRMLPSVVAEKLKNGLTVSAEIYESVSIYFSDVVGFTSISSDSTPIQVVNLLNDLYTLFDDVIAKHDVYKVETIGDAYMVVSGCPNRNGNRHACEIANMSLALRNNVTKFKIRHIPQRQMMIRIGIHTGSCAAGVVGLTMPRYCLFGDTVNVASRMESNGEAMKIHVSEDSFQALSCLNQKYQLTFRGEVELKGKGLCKTYWLDEDNVGE